MAYSQSKKLTAQEKKLATLRTQLYGKEQPGVSSFRFDSPGKNLAPILSNTHSETTYLKNDLKKIGLLAMVIFGVQALLYLSLNRGLINF